FGDTGGGKRARWPARRDLSCDRRESSRPAARRYCRGLSPRKARDCSLMRLSFNPHRHAFVAFSLSGIRVKPGTERFGRRRHSFAEKKLQEIWERPLRRCLNEAS